MSWNYRVVEFVTPEGERFREIREVYYDGDKLMGHCEATIYWEVNTDDDPEAILSAMEAALKEPVIDESEFYNK